METPTPDSRSPIPVYLSLGSNLGDREANLERAIEAIEGLPGTRLVRRSALYETAPWGPVPQPDYLNMVVEISTRLGPSELLRRGKEIEREMGRVTGERWGPRPIDIDILLFGDETIETEELTVPHPRMWERAFVLRPLADLEPEMKGPDGSTVLQLLERESIASQPIIKRC
jgi:2-amino-4-hydroxy-6-hydroxymethyldihydropteridine diphosphokinase